MAEDVLEACGLGVAEVDAACAVQKANAVFTAMFGPDAEGMARGCLAALSQNMLAQMPCELRDAVAGGRHWQGHVPLPEGQVAFVEAFPLRWAGIAGHRVDAGAVEDAGAVLQARYTQPEEACRHSLMPLGAEKSPQDRQAGQDRQDRQVGRDTTRDARRQHVLCFASGVAHDFNNVLASIQGFAEIAASAERDAVSLTGRSVRNILKGCEQARELVGRVRTMGGKVRVDAAGCDVAALTMQWCRDRRGLLPGDVLLETDVCGERVPVNADPQLLEQVFDAVWRNSVQAMPQGGTLHVQVHVQAGEAGGRLPVLLEMRDTGHGMDAATRERCCEPYFTTREAAGARGRGLALARGIVWAHGGEMVVDSVPGAGTTVRIWLPRG
ncbi:ATP-binding protein [Desulfovibrio psychrotolerans]|uniref:histidine kinase n=1 Tax=Desulfovibrio psychrotolerans TaxID=415242 RepID=A0A7J0BUZ7_9BACT|nr:ATP-binding protein [Desulfovibrio psychrotolerans]GFM37012.1 hypothetical protein DSM19430T_16960 [Desulfovibrio psychrotolerans]